MKINIGPSLANLFRQHSMAPLMFAGTMTPVPLQIASISYKVESGWTYEVLMTLAMVAWPEAVMIRDFSTSAGEHTAIGQLVHIMAWPALLKASRWVTY